MSNFILLVWKVYICIYTFYDNESVVTVQISLIYIFPKSRSTIKVLIKHLMGLEPFLEFVCPFIFEILFDMWTFHIEKSDPIISPTFTRYLCIIDFHHTQATKKM
jgi:hypothetical protein